MSLKSSVKGYVAGSVIEGPARLAWHGLTWRARSRRRAVSAQNLRYDELTDAVMKRVLRPDSNCVDAGANEGKILDRMVFFAPKGRHYAFEPLPGLASDLRARFPDVAVYELALSDHIGREQFRYVPISPAHSGFERRPWDWYDESVVELIDVDVSRLDDVLPDNVDVDLIKVDVEGSEAALLRGARRTLERCRPIVVVEVGPNPMEVFDELTAVGLSVSLLDDWLASRAALSADGFRAELERNWYYIGHPTSG
jgi:FkbM family methyltransferase